MKNVLLKLLVLFTFLNSGTVAFAEGFALYEYSARGIALGGAMMARKPDPSAIAYNPALLTKLPGVQVQAGASTISPSGSMRGVDTNGQRFTETLNSNTWFVPHFYYTHQLNDRFTFGIGQFSRFGLGFEYPHNWPGRRNVYEVSLQTASINPVLAFKATEDLSFAAGVEFVYAELDYKKRNTIKGLPGFEVDANIRDATDFGAGFNLASHYQLNENWAVGVQYRSTVKVNNEGEMEYTLVKGQGNPVYENIYRTKFKDGTAKGKETLPDSIAFGVAWTPIANLSVETGAVWTRWSHFKNLDIELPSQNTIARNPKKWKNAWRYNIGVEYEPVDWLALRAGYVYDRSPMTAEYADYLIPSQDRHIYSVGAGVKYEAWTVDLAYAYIDALSRRYSAHDEIGVLHSKTYDGRTHITSMSVGYKF